MINKDRRGHNGEVLSEAVKVIVTLNIHELVRVTDEQIKEAIDNIERLRDQLSSAPEEWFSFDECNNFLELFLVCLGAGIVPQATVVIGKPKESREELERLSRELISKGIIEDAEE